jgi:2-(1,2-epoxy-1,2-dihydrophenyl)acetyl-CoA isomerase
MGEISCSTLKKGVLKLEPVIEVKIVENIGYVKFNRPNKLNALSRELVDQANAALDELSSNSDVKVIILSGEGKSFCAGGDISLMTQIKNAVDAVQWVELASSLSKKIMEIDKYVIAAVHGYAAGAGFSIALACDFIVAHRDAKFAVSFTNIGLIPDLGLIKTISQRVSPPIAKEWISSGKIISVEEAVNQGIVNKVAEGDVLKGAADFAKFILEGPALANKYVKYLVNHVHELSTENAFALESMIQSILLQSEDLKEGALAFLEKRKPNFKGK